ncbi:hypothetical protein Acsp04_18810 [Actinomadura sp. NBRC 104425]|nr:hypothetical protein Acsp04_18810 [Actinomadura sp. NBRC 104425]
MPGGVRDNGGWLTTDEPLPDDQRHWLDLVAALPGSPPPAGSLSHTRLPGGGALLYAVHPAEGRTGPRGEHAYLPDGADGPLPIDLWRSSVGTDGGAVPTERSGSPFASETLVRFAKENASRLAPFLADVRRLFASPAGRQIVLVEDDPETVARWIALACACLPESHARSLTFTTRTAHPHRAPQQIVGIGPDADFDRFDPATVQHRYRVHDGVGGPGSPAATDLWAELAARSWLAGLRPADASDPFDPESSATRLLRLAPLPDDEEGAEKLWRLESLGDEVLHGLVEVLTKIAQTGDSQLLGALTRLCRHLERRHAAAAAPLVRTLARARFSESAPVPNSGGAGGVSHGTDEQEHADALGRGVEGREGAGADEWLRVGGVPGPHHRSPAGQPPPGGRARPEPHRESGPPADPDPLHRRLAGPVGTWAAELKSRLAADTADDALVEAAADRLADALLAPADGERREALALLDRARGSRLPRAVLHTLEIRTRTWQGRTLAVNIGPLLGDWLRDAVDDGTSLPFRLAEAVVRCDRLKGVDLLAALIEERMPGRHVPDAPTLETAWYLVWPDGRPPDEEIPELARVCPPSLIVDTGLDQYFRKWLTDPDRFDETLIDYAREMKRVLLPPRLGTTVELLVRTSALVERSVPLPDAVDTLFDARRRADPTPTLIDGVFRTLADRLAQAPPRALWAQKILHPLATERDPALAEHYRRAELAAKWKRVDFLLDHPQQAAYLFMSWCFATPGSTDAWRRVCGELLTVVLSEAWRRMDGPKRLVVHETFRFEQPGWEHVWRGWLASLPAEAPHPTDDDRPHGGIPPQRGPA